MSVYIVCVAGTLCMRESVYLCVCNLLCGCMHLCVYAAYCVGECACIVASMLCVCASG